MKLCYFIIFTVLFFSCMDHSAQTKKDTVKLFEAIGVTPSADSLKPPIITLLDTCPKPATINIPSKPLTYIQRIGNRIDTLHLSPPETRPAGFYAPMTTYTGDQGLYSTIVCIKRDKNGNMWFGTQGGGVIRYDGKTFTTYTSAQGLANNTVWSILEDQVGNMWFGTDGGLSRYNGKEFTTYTSEQGLANDVVLSIAEDKEGRLWFGTKGGVSRVDPRQKVGAKGEMFTNYSTTRGLTDSVVVCIAEDKNGNLWFGTTRGVSRFDGKFFTNYTTADGLASNAVKSVAADKRGGVWFGTDGGGVSRYDPSAVFSPDTKSFTTYTNADGLGSNTVLSILEDNSGLLWFGTGGGGVSCLDPRQNFEPGGKSLTTFTTARGLANNTVWTIAEDKSGNLWFGTDGGGASRYDGKSFTTYTSAQGLTNDLVLSLAEDDSGGHWFGTDGGGVCRYDPSASNKTGSPAFTVYATAQGLPDGSVQSIMEDKNRNLWFGTKRGGVSRYNGKSLTTYTVAQGLAGHVIVSMVEDKNGNLWFGTQDGVSCYSSQQGEYGGQFITYKTDQGLINNTVWSMAEDKNGCLWLATQGGVSCFKPGAASPFTNFTTAQGLANNSVWSVTEDKSGNMWFGTNGGGVSRYDGKTFMTYTTAQGLANNVVYGIVEDKKAPQTNGIWFGTNEGFSMIAGYKACNGRDSGLLPADNSRTNEDLSKNYSPVFETYNFRNGYPVKDVNTNAMLIDRNGIIWAGTGDKLVRFDYGGIHKNMDPPHVFVNSVKIGGENICWSYLKSRKQNGDRRKLGVEDSMVIINEETCLFGSILTDAARDTIYRKFAKLQFDSVARFYLVPVNLVLPYQHNNISFDFAAVEPARPFLVNYQYILEGYDKDWSPVTNKTSATFGNIPEGSYTFKLKAQSPDGVWSLPITYNFTVLPPIYRTWWAYSLYVIIFVCSLFGLFHWRTASLRKEKEHLEEVVVERTAQVVKLVEEQEQTIEQRTAELANANKKLVELIQYNAHYMREPLARVMGGLSISEFLTHEEFFEDVVPQINRAVNDLDNAIMQVIKVADETVELKK